jgi:hypothetical protein
MNKFRAYYSIIRYVPNLAREEFVNVGVLLICPDAPFQKVLTLASFGEYARFKALPSTDGQFVRHAVTQLREAVSSGDINSLLGKQTGLDLVHTDLSTLVGLYSSNNLQFSQPRTAATTDPQATLELLFTEFVGAVPQAQTPKSITRTVILRESKEVFSSLGLFDKGLQERWAVPTPTAPRLDFAYQNHVWHGYQAISFVGNEQSVIKDVNAYRMTARELQEDNSQPPELREAKLSVLGHISQQPRVQNLIAALQDSGIDVLDHREVPEIAKDIARDLQHLPI